MWLKNKVYNRMEKITNKYTKENEKAGYEKLTKYEWFCLISVIVLYFSGTGVLLYAAFNTKGWAWFCFAALGFFLLFLFYLKIKIGSYINEFKISHYREYYKKNCEKKLDKLEKKIDIEKIPSEIRKEKKKLHNIKKSIKKKKNSSKVPDVFASLTSVAWGIAESPEEDVVIRLIRLFFVIEGARVVIISLIYIVLVIRKHWHKAKLKNLKALYARHFKNSNKISNSKKRNKKKHSKKHTTNLKCKTNLKATVDVYCE